MEAPAAGRRAGVGQDEATSEPAIDLKASHARIGDLALETDFCPTCSAKRNSERKAMIEALAAAE